MSLHAYALTTVQRVASYLGITVVANSATDILLQNLINGVTDFVENYIGFRVQQATVSNEQYDTEKGDILVLNRAPVSAVTLQRRNSGLNEDEWETIAPEFYHVDTDAGIIYGAGGWQFARTRRGYRVSYTAGYNFDNNATFLSDTEASDLELAAWILVTTVYNRRKGGGDIKSESIGDYRVVYGGALMENDDVKAILDKYADVEQATYLTPANT